MDTAGAVVAELHRHGGRGGLQQSRGVDICCRGALRGFSPGLPPALTCRRGREGTAAPDLRRGEPLCGRHGFQERFDPSGNLVAQVVPRQYGAPEL